MGTWGAGSFENDTALDFSNYVSDLEVVKAVLKRPVDVADEEVLVAAEIVAAMMQRPCLYFPESLTIKLKAFGAAGDDLIALARNTAATIRDNSELSELWAESGDPDWIITMNDLVRRLDPNTDYTAPDAPEFEKTDEIGFGCILCHKDGSKSEEVKIAVEKDDGVISYSYTHYAHRDCVLNMFVSPHFNEDGSPHPDLISRLNNYIETRTT